MKTVTSIKSLGYGGLVPFVLLALVSGYTNDPLAHQALGVYSFGILIFLAGSWWGIGLLRQNGLVLVVSNLVFLLAAGLFFVLSSVQWLWASSGLFVLLFMLEGRLSVFARQPAYYRALRRYLTVGVAASQLGLAVWRAV